VEFVTTRPKEASKQKNVLLLKGRVYNISKPEVAVAYFTILPVPETVNNELEGSGRDLIEILFWNLHKYKAL
jgi:hypothetical protein